MNYLPENIWALWTESSVVDRVICSPLDHGEEKLRYVRADIVDGLLDEACAIIKKGQAAASASYHQAYAEWRGHDKEQDKQNAIVSDFRNAARRFLLAREAVQ